MEKSIWNAFRNLVNSQPIGSKISKRDIGREMVINHFDNGKWGAFTPKDHYGFMVSKYFSQSTLESYINMAVKCLYLNRDDKTHYTLIKPFPNDYKIGELRKEYDNNRKSIKG